MIPPSVKTVVAVRYAAASLARNATTLAISPGSAMRASGIAASRTFILPGSAIVEALIAAGADRDYFTRRDSLEMFAAAQSGPARTVSVQRDEEHNRFLLHVEDRSNGYPRVNTVGVDFVSSVEYRTLMANHRDMAAISGEIIVEMILDMQTSVEIKLPGRFPVSPQIAGALKAVAGVVDVQTV